MCCGREKEQPFMPKEGPSAERVSDGGEKGPDCQVLPPVPRLWVRRGSCPC